MTRCRIDAQTHNKKKREKKEEEIKSDLLQVVFHLFLALLASFSCCLLLFFIYIIIINITNQSISATCLEVENCLSREQLLRVTRPVLFRHVHIYLWKHFDRIRRSE